MTMPEGRRPKSRRPGGRGHAGPEHTCRQSRENRRDAAHHHRSDVGPRDKERSWALHKGRAKAMSDGEMTEGRRRLLSLQSERVFQEHVIQFAKRHGWLVFHDLDSRRNRAGFPDLTMAHKERGLVVFAELKSQKGRVTPEQKEWLAALGETCAVPVVWRPLDTDTVEEFLSGDYRNPHDL